METLVKKVNRLDAIYSNYNIQNRINNSSTFNFKYRAEDNWIDKSLYPFENNYIQLPTGKMHYIDEGKGEVLLFIHGTPTWSFLYRNFINHFKKTHRCIAIDHLGFGLSEKPTNFDGTPESHAKNLTYFIKLLGLQDITLVVHDFGGPIGLSSAIKNSKKIKQIVLFNSWLWETKSDQEVIKIDRILNSWIGRMLYLNLNFSPRVILKNAFYDKKQLAKKVHQHYLKPFPNKNARLSLLKLGKSLLGSSDWYNEQNNNIALIKNKPWLILWGTKDKFLTTEYLSKWKKILPQATVSELNSGHFVQEEQTTESIKLIDKFIN